MVKDKEEMTLLSLMKSYRAEYDRYMTKMRTLLDSKKQVTQEDFNMTEGLYSPPQWHSGEIPEHDETCMSNCICKQKKK